MPLPNKQHPCEKKFRAALALLQNRILPHSPLLVAVSGGADSVALLHLLLASRDQLQGCSLHVLHFNHMLRGEESNRDAQFVADLATRMGIDSLSESKDVLKLSHHSGESLEMVARQARYQTFASHAARLGCSMIFMGHHANDQAELFFLRLFRGTSTHGLAGMRLVSPFPDSSICNLLIARPLLYCKRSEIEDYLRQNNISWRTDSSNQSNDILRNRIRNQLIPLLEKSYQPNVICSLSRTMETLGADDDFAKISCATSLRQIPSPPFESLHLALQRRLVTDEMIRLRLTPSFEAIEYLIKNPEKLLSCGQKFLRRIPGSHHLSCETPPNDWQSEEITVELKTHSPSTITLPGPADLKIQLELTTADKCQFQKNHRKSKTFEYFDLNKTGYRIVLRHWKPGDRFQQIGMVSPKKLQDIFTNQKIPITLRHHLWLAVNQDGIIFWVQKLRIGEACKITDTTQNILKMNFQHPTSQQ